MKRIIFAMAAMAIGASCGDDGGAQPMQDAAPVVDASSDAAPHSPCFSGTPTTHDQIINACTNAQEIFIDRKPPLLDEDGSLPPLPP